MENGSALVKAEWWDERKAQAALMIFEARYPLATIAAEIGVSPRTLDYWIAYPDFQARLATMRAHLEAALLDPASLPYVTKAQRVRALAQLAETARRLFEEQPTIPHQSGAAIFNAPAFHAVRDALADIAAELGERKKTPVAVQDIAQVMIEYVNNWRKAEA